MHNAHDRRVIALQRRKRIAGALLVAAAVALLLTRIAQRHSTHWALGLLAAMSEAALVGGLADWFAVVALFRHPLGQRWIPHTAIIPTRKNAIGESLADFVCDHFLGREQVEHKLRAVDFGSALAHRLHDPATGRKVGQVVVRALPRLLDSLLDERLLGFVQRLSREKLRTLDLSSVAALGLDAFTAEGRHQALVTELLRFVAEKLETPEVQDEVKRRVGREVGRVLSWLGADGLAAGRLISAGIELIGEMAEDPDHEVRQYVDRQVHALAGRLRTDESLRRDVAEYRDRLLDGDAFGAYTSGLLGDLTAWVERDAARSDSVIAARIEQGLGELGARMLGDTAMREWIDSSVRAMVLPLVDEHRDSIRTFIVERIHRWNAEEMTREMELAVGSDLQYIRYNGTAVGALVGGLIFLALHTVGLIA